MMERLLEGVRGFKSTFKGEGEAWYDGDHRGG